MKNPIRLALLGLCATSLLSLQTLRADDSSSTNAPPSAPPPPHEGRGHGGAPPWLDQLGLTDSQKEQIKQIFKQTEDERRRQVDAVLTADQKAKLQQIMAEHKGRGDGPPPPSDSGSGDSSSR